MRGNLCYNKRRAWKSKKMLIFRGKSMQKQYDVIIIGAGPGGIFSAYELVRLQPEWNVAVFEAGNELQKRRCPIDGDKVKSCINCKS